MIHHGTCDILFLKVQNLYSYKLSSPASLLLAEEVSSWTVQMANSVSHPAYAGLSSSESAALEKLQNLCQQHDVFWPTSTVAEESGGKGDNNPFTLL